MDDAPFGLIEIVLGFGVLLGLAIWEVIRNRRALDAVRKRTDDGAR